jgi:hypothetical protein
MIRALVPVMDDFVIFSSSVSADALANTLIPGSVIRDGLWNVESPSSTDDSDG